ncbi:TonB-linked outer membrane protein, SusC/RagA family [Chitinophaga jiangningensis]|uniref:TonB-linked outer membrane protein, SusC/RagA family n=1 Tax=Chitinophaga jiangningensis TaxID=1419482 RepID=A0A1M6ZTH6_9BACT|nr:SusC/RagA family TonB-linked outer membrane protein [Chitinophaga jiangningensis]SHL33736.1 TonB-linked outer membrane protein, SusC/RagA family [Chitinophaga jiangningensis]
MRKLIVLSLSLLLGGSMTAAAQQVLKGTVKDSLTKQPVPGATVKVVGSNKGATTNAAGEFELNVPANAQLQISSMGFENVIVKAALISTGPVLLKIQAVDLSSAVVVGYGTQKRATVTNAISTVSSSSLTPEKNIVSDAAKALQGRVAGVYVASTGGTPGATPNIQIRGAQSVSAAGTNPLIVIDGLIVEGNTVNLNTINPQDIESMEVLKDAASAAIYGARGSGGVIIITTKKGKTNSKPAFSLNAYTGVNNVPTSRRMLNTEEYTSAFNDARNNRLADIDKRLKDPTTPANEITQLNNEINNLKSQIAGLNMANRSTDWIDRIKNKNAPINNIQASMSGGSEKSSYYMSLGRYAEEMVWGSGNYERYTAKLDITQTVNNWLKLNGGLSINQSVLKNLSNPIATAFQARPDTPDEPVRNADGSLGYYIGMQQHPLGVMQDNKNRNKVFSYIGRLTADISFTKDLQFRSSFNASKYNSLSRDFYSPLTYLGTSSKGSTKTSGQDNFNFTFDNYFTYTKRVNKLGINAVAGYTYYSTELNAIGYDLNGYPVVDGITGAGAGSAYGSVGAIANYNIYNKELSDAFFARTGFDWEGKYLLNASLRRDGSSKLLADNRYSWFPSISGGWDIAKENFLYGNKLISQLKLRSSYGMSGNIRPLGYWDAQNLLLATSYNGLSALQINSIIGNPNIRWERTRQVDAGIDATMFGNRLTIVLDYYNKTTDGLMSSNQVSWVYGAASTPDNIGNIRNKGVDLEMGLSSKAGRKFSWKVSTNMNINKNEIISLKDSLTNYGTFVFGGPQSKAKVGQSVGSVLVYESQGVDPQTGDMIYTDRNKDGLWNTNDMITVPIAMPKFTGGTTLTFGYKGFTLDALFTYVVGNKVYDYYEQTLRSYDRDFYGAMPNMFDVVTKRWRKPGDVTDVPRAITGKHGAGQTADWNYRPSTQFIYNASYFRLRNVNLSYAVPATLISKAKINSARIYVAAQNLFTITKYIGFDPEAASNSGVVSTNVPNPQSAVIGIDVSF